MAMVVNHNIPALQTYNVVNATQGALSKSIQKLSTGLRINSAADDAAGLAISEKMRAQISGLSKATDNAQDGISMLQTAEGALSETHSILQRMRELSVQAANDTLTAQDRSYIQLEIDQLREEVTRIGNTTQFNTKKLLNGDAAVLWSSSDNTTKAIINGGLRTIDQFGQKSSAEGNYKIEIKAEPGAAQVQKTDIFKVKHPNVVMNKSVNVAAGVEDVKVNNVPAGSYIIKTLAGEGAAGNEEIHQLTVPDLTDANAATLQGKDLVLNVAGAPFTVTFSNSVTTLQGVADEINAAAKSPTAAAQDTEGVLANFEAKVDNGKLVLEYKAKAGEITAGDSAITITGGTATQGKYTYSVKQKLDSGAVTTPSVFDGEKITITGKEKDAGSLSIESGAISASGASSVADLVDALNTAFDGDVTVSSYTDASSDTYLVFEFESDIEDPDITLSTDAAASGTNAFSGDPSAPAQVYEHTATVEVKLDSGKTVGDFGEVAVAIDSIGTLTSTSIAGASLTSSSTIENVANALKDDPAFVAAGVTVSFIAAAAGSDATEPGSLVFTYHDNNAEKPSTATTITASSSGWLDGTNTTVTDADTDDIKDLSEKPLFNTTMKSEVVEAEEGEAAEGAKGPGALGWARGLGKADAQYEHSLELGTFTDGSVKALTGRTLTISLDGDDVDVAFTKDDTASVDKVVEAINAKLGDKAEATNDNGKITLKYVNSSDKVGAIATSGSATKSYSYTAAVTTDGTVSNYAGKTLKLTIDGTEMGTITISSDADKMKAVAADLKTQLADYGITDVKAVTGSAFGSEDDDGEILLFTYASGNEASATSKFELSIDGGSSQADTTYKHEAVFTSVDLSGGNNKKAKFNDGDTEIETNTLNIGTGASATVANLKTKLNDDSAFKAKAQADVVDNTNLKITYYSAKLVGEPTFKYDTNGSSTLVEGSHVVTGEPTDGPIAVLTSAAPTDITPAPEEKPEEKPEADNSGTIQPQATPGSSPKPLAAASYGASTVTVTEYTHTLAAPTVADDDAAKALAGKTLDITVGGKKATVTFADDVATAADANKAITDKLAELAKDNNDIEFKDGTITFTTTDEKYKEAGAIKIEGTDPIEVPDNKYVYKATGLELVDDPGNSTNAPTYGNFAGGTVTISFDSDSGYDPIVINIAGDADFSNTTKNEENLATAINNAVAEKLSKSRATVDDWGLEATAGTAGSNKINLEFTGQFTGTAPQVTITIAASGSNTDGGATSAITGTPSGNTTTVYPFGQNPTTSSAAPASAQKTLSMSTAIEAAVDQDNIKTNANILLEVTNVDKAAGTVTFSARALTLGKDGTTSTLYKDNIVVREGKDAVALFEKELGKDAFKISITEADAFEKGSKLVFNATMSKENVGENAVEVAVTGIQNQSWSGKWGDYVTEQPVYYTLDSEETAGKDIHFTNYYVNSLTGEVNTGDIIVTTTKDGLQMDPEDETIIATFDAAYIGQTAAEDVALRDLDKFWTTEGVFMLADAQTVTLTQGDGKQTSVTLYGTDTLKEVADKLNDAIAVGLGQGKYLTVANAGDNPGRFVTFVSNNKATKGTSESVEGTFVIRSIVPGKAGEINIAASENLSNALSLNEIQAASDSEYRVTVRDAHTETIIADNVKITGNKLVGVINENVDVVFDAMAGVKATWDDKNKRFTLAVEDESNPYTTILHLADNTTVFQIGANEGEDMGVNIGDMRSTALGLDDVLVTDRESASRSITIIDNAIDKVSTQRAKLGAYQNRLEHTITNLTTAHENLTSAESRIRDTDMAKEMMNFMKLQITLQAGTSMLAQANQLSRNVLSLLS